jgi:acyl-CoA thioesterase-2
MSTDHRPLEDLFRLTQVGDDNFRGPAPSRVAHAHVDGQDQTTDTQVQRAFGGQVAGQSLAAASATVTDRHVHSMHAYFLAGADPSMPVEFVVRRLRDGRNFSSRWVEATQGDRSIFVLTASFRTEEAGLQHQEAMPPAPHPDSLAAASGAEAFEWSSIDLRFAEQWGGSAEAGHVARRLVWFRLRDRINSDDRSVHSAALAYASDLTLIRTALGPHRHALAEGGITLASIDHAVWFHRPARVDEWLLYSSVSPSASRGLALAIGHVFTLDGALVATVVQEGSLAYSRRPAEYQH